MRTRSCSVALVVLLSIAGAGALQAGPLDPPVGPIASTYKTLTEVEPRVAINAINTPGDADSLYKITQPGSYYLTGNITGVVGKHGIKIAASGVTLDLNGFSVVGTPGMGAYDGVTIITSGIMDIAVRNGSVRGWGRRGIDLSSFTPENCTASDIRASGNVGGGISVSSGLVSNCAADQNGGDGITLSGIGTVTNCTATFSANDGISLSGSGSTVSGCSSSFNTGDGIQVNAADLVIGNICRGNGNGGDGAGIHATGSDNRIEGNNCVNADRGVDVDSAGNFIVRNTCTGNVLNWDIVANNVYGPILDRSAPASAAVSGNAGPGSLGTTDPNANFTF